MFYKTLEGTMAAPESHNNPPKRVSLAKLTTLGVGGEADLWEVESLTDLREATAEPYREIGRAHV